MEFLFAVAVLLADEKDDVAAAAKKLQERSSFSFKGETRTEMPGMMGGMGDSDPSTFEGKYEKDVGSFIKTPTHEFITVGDKTATRPLSDWKLLEDEADPMALQKRMMSMMSGSRAVRSPHLDFKDFGSKIAKAKKSKRDMVGETACDLYEVEFTEDAAKEILTDMLPWGNMMGMMPDTEITGSAKVWIDDDGRILKYESKGSLSANAGGMDLEMSASRTVTFSNFDETKVEIPEDVKKLMNK
jgi:hypothetical protein